MEWDHEAVEKVIDLYKNKPELWYPQDNNYHIKFKKHDAWLQIAQDMHCDVDEVKTKMASLLSGYRREKMKINKSAISGRPGIYKSNWFAFKHFHFLKDKEALHADNHNYFQDQPVEKFEWCLDDSILNERTLPLEARRGQESGIKISQVCSAPKRKSSEPLDSNEDKFDIIGKNVANKLRDLDADVALVSEKLISDVLFEAAMGHLTKHSRISFFDNETEPFR